MLKRVRWVLFLGLALGLSAYGSADAQTLDTIKQSKIIRLGYIADEKPFSFRKADGSPVGYAIDLCRRIADEIALNVSGLKKNYIETTLSDGFGAVKDGKIDLLCGATTINLARRESVDFSQPIFLTGASALLRKDSPDYLQILFLDKRPVSAVDLKSPTQSSIGVRAGTTTGATLRDAIGPDVPQTRIVDFPTHEDGLKALEDQRIDAYFADRSLLIGLADRAGNPSELELGSRLFTHEPYGIAMRRDDSAFRLLVDRTLTGLYTSSDFPKLLKTYFGAEAPALRSEIMMQSIPE